MIIQNSCILTIRPYDSKANTIYEFLGDYWHGNPVKYDKNNTNEKCKKHLENCIKTPLYD